jgi:hypothetical protein
MDLENEEDITNREEVEAKLGQLDSEGKPTSHPSTPFMCIVRKSPILTLS